MRPRRRSSGGCAHGFAVSGDAGPEGVLGEIAGHLRELGRPFALVGGLAVSLRAEVRFTRDVDLAIDLDLEAVRADLAEITRRGFHRGQDLLAKLEVVLREAAER